MAMLPDYCLTQFPVETRIISDCTNTIISALNGGDVEAAKAAYACAKRTAIQTMDSVLIAETVGTLDTLFDCI